MKLKNFEMFFKYIYKCIFHQMKLNIFRNNFKYTFRKNEPFDLENELAEFDFASRPKNICTLIK